MLAILQSAGQVLVLLIFATGGGGWLWLVAGRPPLARNRAWVWLGFAGLALIVLLLQSLVYAGIPLRHTTGPALLLALVGLGIAGWQWRGGGSRRLGRDLPMSLVLLLLALAGQSSALVSAGPARFFGLGTYDQANYVALADLLVEVPLTTPAEQIGHRPWLVPAWEPKEQRITEAVLLGATAVATGVSSQEAYGLVNIVLVALAGLAVMHWLRALGLSRGVAAGAGLVAALTPALTRVHLEGYFSQTASLFVLPALAGIFGANGPLRREAGLAGGVLLAYFLGTYSEVAVFGFAVVGALVIVRRETVKSRVTVLLATGALALLLNPGYLARVPDFIARQSRAAGDVSGYRALFPESGTLSGWGRQFCDLPWPWANEVVGIGIIAFAFGGAVAWARVRRLSLALVLGLALGALLVVRLQPEFRSYVFAKLGIQFVPLLAAAAATGLAAIGQRMRFRRRWVAAGLAATAVVAWLGARPFHDRVAHPAGTLAVLRSEQLAAVRRDAEQHPARNYLVSSNDPILAQWLCYFGRHSRVTVDRRTVGDRILATEAFACRRWDPQRGDLHWLDAERAGRVADYEPAPTLRVEGAIETGDDEGKKYFVAGPSLDFVFERGAAGEPRSVWLDFVVVPWRATGPCQLELSDDAGHAWKLELPGIGWSRWPLLIPPGGSGFRLRLSAPGVPTGEPVALLKLISVETSSELPAWQRVSEAVPLAAAR